MKTLHILLISSLLGLNGCVEHLIGDMIAQEVGISAGRSLGEKIVKENFPHPYYNINSAEYCYDDKFSEKELIKNDEAIIILQSNKDLAIFDLQEDKIEEINNSIFFEKGKSHLNYFNIYKIDSGSYIIKNGFAIYGQNICIKKIHSNQPAFLHIDIQAGDVLYIGSNIHEEKYLDFKDNFQDAQDFIEKKYPNLSPYLRKKLIIKSILPFECDFFNLYNNKEMDNEKPKKEIIQYNERLNKNINWESCRLKIENLFKEFLKVKRNN